MLGLPFSDSIRSKLLLRRLGLSRQLLEADRGIHEDDLDSQASAKVATAIVRLELGNLSNVKWIGGGVGEYRIDWGPGYRLYLARDGDELIYHLSSDDH